MKIKETYSVKGKVFTGDNENTFNVIAVLSNGDVKPFDPVSDNLTSCHNLSVEQQDFIRAGDIKSAGLRWAY